MSGHTHCWASSRARNLVGVGSWAFPRVRTVAGAALATALVTGCSPSPAPSAAIGNRFYGAIGASDWAVACMLLAPDTKAELEQSAGKACAAALAEESLPDPGPAGRSVQYGTMTQVRYRQDTVFLARFPSGWKVMAAGCSPVAGHPYDCRLQGG
jgi:hypothetical protein